MRLKTFILLLVLVSMWSPGIYAWGSRGHDIIVAIAERHISGKARDKIKCILDGKSMVYYSSWMDNIRGDKQYGARDAWHYANVDEGKSYETMKKNPEGDVYTALTFIIAQLKGGWLDKETETIYFKYMIHLVGDMHCPMHVGHLSDAGGNKTPARWFGAPTNLHAIWDDYLVDNVRKWSYTEWVENIDLLSKDEIEALSRGTIEDWLNETVEICAKVYAETPANANFDYYMMNSFYPIHVLKASFLKPATGWPLLSTTSSDRRSRRAINNLSRINSESLSGTDCLLLMYTAERQCVRNFFSIVFYITARDRAEQVVCERTGPYAPEFRR